MKYYCPTCSIVVRLRGSRGIAVWPPKLAGLQVGGIGIPKSKCLFPLRIFGKMAPMFPSLSQSVRVLNMGASRPICTLLILSVRRHLEIGVGFDGGCGSACGGRRKPSVPGRGWPSLVGTRSRRCYIQKIRVLKASLCSLNTLAWKTVIGLWSCSCWSSGPE